MRKALIVLLFLVLAAPLFAWEADVHYGLTRWLAEAAGFKPAVAEQIAQADYSADLGSFYPATWAVGLHIMIHGDVGASRNVQKLHFPSYGPVPGAPKDRAVPLNSPRAVDWLKKQTAFPNNADNEATELEEFGFAIHSLQDSWSHAGVPDVALRCFAMRAREELSWAHPIDRGGWAVHDADLTYLWKDDVINRPIDMAQNTYDALVAYGQAHPSLLAKKPLLWTQLSPSVARFIAAGTKEAKTDWFQQSKEVAFSGFRNRTFNEGLSLPTSSFTLRVVKASCDVTGQIVEEVISVVGQIPGVIQDFFDNYLKTWLVDRRIGAAIELIDRDEIGRQLQGMGFSAQADEWSRKYLTMWLLRDHGFVNQNGHGLPKADGYARLPVDPAQSGETGQRPPFATVDQAIIAPGTNRAYALDELRWTGPGTPGRYFAATFRFRDQPHDALILVAKQTGQTIRIARLLWVVE